MVLRLAPLLSPLSLPLCSCGCVRSKQVNRQIGRKNISLLSPFQKWVPSPRGMIFGSLPPCSPLYISYMQRKRGGRGGLESCDNLFSGEQGGRDDAPVFAKCIIHDRGRANNPVSQPYLLMAKSPFFTFFCKKEGEDKGVKLVPLAGRKGRGKY